jgi:hypothetical protein
MSQRQDETDRTFVSQESSQYRSAIRVSYRIASLSESQSEPSAGLSYARRGSVRSAGVERHEGGEVSSEVAIVGN